MNKIEVKRFNIQFIYEHFIQLKAYYRSLKLDKTIFLISLTMFGFFVRLLKTIWRG